MRQFFAFLSVCFWFCIFRFFKSISVIYLFIKFIIFCLSVYFLFISRLNKLIKRGMKAIHAGKLKLLTFHSQKIKERVELKKTFGNET